MSSEVDVKLIKELRAKSNAGVLDCKNALIESKGDVKKAIQILRKKGIAEAAKKMGRSAKEGIIFAYVHPGSQKAGVVELNCETDFVARSDEFRDFAHEIALQIAAAAPKWVKAEHIPEDVIEHEKEIARARYKEEGKPDNIIEKILEGMVVKFKTENCLLEQAYIRDEDLTIQELLHEKIASIGENILIRRFERWERGESID